MTPSLLDTSGLRRQNSLLQKLIQMYFQLVVLAMCWIGLASLVGMWRLNVNDADTYGFVLQIFSMLLIAGAGCVRMLRTRRKSRLLWAGLLVLDMATVHFLVQTQPALLGADHAFVVVPTALIAMAVLLSFWVHPDAVISDSWIVTAVALAGTCISVTGAYLMIERDLRQVHGYAQARAEFVSHSIQVWLEEPVMAVSHMTERWNVLEHEPSRAYIEQEFLSHISGIEAIQRFTVLEANGQIGVDRRDNSYPDNGDVEQAQRVMAFWAFLDQVRLQGKTLMSRPGLVPGKPQIVFVAAPIGEGYPKSGWLLATVDLDLVIKDAFVNDEPPCCFAVKINQFEVYRSSDDEEVPRLAQATKVFDFEKNFTVEIFFWKKLLPGEIGLSYYPLMVLLVGLLFTFFLMVSLRFAQISSFRAQLLFDQSRCDPLTGLPNRRVLQEELERLSQQAGQHGRIGLMFVDLRGMRLINDSLGHEVADQLLLSMTERLQAALPERAWLARLDGGEFVVTVRDADNDSLTSLAKTLLKVISVPQIVQGREFSVPAVIGMSSSGAHLSDPMQLVREADLAMISAKSDGQSAWAYYEPSMGELSALKLMLSHDLHAALEAGQLSMVYQPLVSTRTGKVVAMEALVRWHHPERGLISPALFIPLAEETGQIVALTHWTLGQVCADFKAMHAGLIIDDVPVAVNISPLYFQRDDLIEQIAGVLSCTGLSAQQLQLEITEGLLLKNQTDAIQKIRALRDMGIITSLDDFGTGYSSLSYLKDLPIHKIKLDRSFVQNVTENRAEAEIVRGVINIAHELDLQVVVEGVETSDQAKCLAQLQADQLQGYVFSRPLTAMDMRALLKDNTAFSYLQG